MHRLLSVEEALERIFAQISSMSFENVPVPDALTRVLAEDVFSTLDIPPFANSSMDGYAVVAADVQRASPDLPVRLQVVADIPAGTISTRSLLSGQVARIMTGAPLPPGADAVVPVEDTSDNWRSEGDAAPALEIDVFRTVQPGDYVRQSGEDVKQGALVLRRGTLVRPQDLGVLVSIGLSDVAVYRRPHVAILATGDELIDFDDEVHKEGSAAALPAGHIRNSNSYVLAGLVIANGGVAHRLPVARDNLADVRMRFAEALALQPDLIVSSAGVSVGTRDVVRTVVEELGEISFWRVNVRPGKPLVFGSVRGVPFFGLPGNPVSSMVTFEVFVRPSLMKLQGLPVERSAVVKAFVDGDVESDGRRTYMRVRLENRDGRLIATSTGTQSSGALMSMVKADGLVVIPEGVTRVRAGSELQVWLLRDLGHTLI